MPYFGVKFLHKSSNFSPPEHRFFGGNEFVDSHSSCVWSVLVGVSKLLVVVDQDLDVLRSRKKYKLLKNVNTEMTSDQRYEREAKFPPKSSPQENFKQH